MKKCTDCNGTLKEFRDKTPDGVEYKYFKCNKCGEEILDMKQLHQVAQKYRHMKKYHAKISKWGMSLGMRIPKDLAKKYGFKDEREVTIIPEDEGIKVIPT